MAGRFTPHLGVAAGIVVVALLVALPPLLAGGGSYPVLETVPRVAVPAAPVVPASTAADPLVPAYDQVADVNPFTLRATNARGPAVKIPLPPAPPLDPPGPPLLPLPEAK